MRLREVKVFKVMPGTTIEEAIQEAHTIAKEQRCIVKFRFNGIGWAKKKRR